MIKNIWKNLLCIMVATTFLAPFIGNTALGDESERSELKVHDAEE